MHNPTDWKQIFYIVLATVIRRHTASRQVLRWASRVPDWRGSIDWPGPWQRTGATAWGLPVSPLGSVSAGGTRRSGSCRDSRGASPLTQWLIGTEIPEDGFTSPTPLARSRLGRSSSR